MLCEGPQVQRPDCLGKEALPQPLSFGHVGAESFARWQPPEEFDSVVSFFQNLPGSGGALPGVDLQQVGQCCPGGAFCEKLSCP